MVWDQKSTAITVDKDNKKANLKKIFGNPEPRFTLGMSVIKHLVLSTLLYSTTLYPFAVFS